MDQREKESSPIIDHQAAFGGLRPGQTDQDSLPPYEVLDAILDALCGQREHCPEIVAAGYEESTVNGLVRPD